MGNIDHITFDQCVRESKAVEWLLRNDSFVKSFATMVHRSPIHSVLCAVDCARSLQRKVLEVAARMEVTEEERRNGYKRQSVLWSWDSFDQAEQENELLREALKKARLLALSHGYTMRDFAKQINVSPSQLSRWTDETPNREPDFKD